MTLGCTPAEPPERLEVLRLHGTPYERGLQHGQQLKSKIASFYTTMLTTSLLPYLNREQSEIAAVLTSYDPKKHPEYGGGQFSLRLLQESARELEKSIPQDLRDEMRGIADGSGQPYENILVLNTFVDTVMGARSVTYFLRSVQSPRLSELKTLGDVEHDGVDNDANGQTDETGDGGTADYATSATATLVEVPLDSPLRLVLSDTDGVDPTSVRILVDGQVYQAGHPSVQIGPKQLKSGPSKTDLQVDWTPPTPLPAAKIVTVVVQASDTKVLLEPPPAHARAMRTEQWTLTTKGAGLQHAQVPNRGIADGTSQPPSLAVGLRGSATASGKPLLGHHFSLLDAGTSHKHCVVQIHQPTDGPAFAVVGWAGIVWGFSGVSSRGVSYAANLSDTLNNPIVRQVRDKLFDAKLLSGGVPAGVIGRRLLQETKTAQEAAELVGKLPQSFGWNFVLADAAGGLLAVETHANIEETNAVPSVYGPNPTGGDLTSRSSVGADDVRATVHFRKLAEDLSMTLLYDVRPQRNWSSYFFASLRAHLDLGEEIAKRYGKLDVASMQAVLRLPNLVDHNDSMNAVVIEPASRRLHVAAGQVPATDAPFRTFELPAVEP